MAGPDTEPAEPAAPTSSPATTAGPTAAGANSGAEAGTVAPWYRSKAPARPNPRALAVATATSIVALVVLVAVGRLLGETVLIPPLAATMALVAGGSALPLAQPRNVIGGQLVSALVAFIVLAIAGSSVWGAAVAGGLALGAMLLLRASHSPGAATAVMVVLERPEIVRFLALLLLATVLLVAVGAISARANRTTYPVYWW
jgi:CBS-domain-containing membrane protein